MNATVLPSAVETLARLDANELPEALTKIAAIVSALPNCNAPDQLDAIAAALPRRVGAYPAELALALAKLAFELAHHRPQLPEDRDALAPALRVAWMRVCLTVSEDPAELAAIEDGLLLRIFGDWPDALLDATMPILLLDRSAGAADPRLRALALERIASAVEHVAITSEQACACLVRLARDQDPGLRRAAFVALRKRSARIGPALEADRRTLIADGLDDGYVNHICSRLAADLGERELMADFAFDEKHDPERRSVAMSWLGVLARDGDLGRVFAAFHVDPLLFGSSVRQFLLRAHRRGVFIHDADIPALLDAFDCEHSWTGDELVRVAHIARIALLAELARLPAGDRRWIRRAAILAASVDSDAHILIATQLRATSDLPIAAALIDAAGRSPDYCDEDALLAWLPHLPEPVIAALYAKGSERSSTALRELVGDRRCPTDLRAAAMTTLWALSKDRRALLHELSQRIGPRAAGLFDSKHLSARDGTAAQILLELGPLNASWGDDIEPLAALTLLCEAGKPELLSELTRLFRIVFAEHVRAALAGDFTIKRTRIPELEQLIYRYARHLIADGRRVRRWIEDEPETGDALVLGLAIDWLHEDPPAPICVALLETIGRKNPTGGSLRKIQRYWRHGDPEIKRAALEAIVTSKSDAHGLTLSIGRLAAAEDAKIVRQALIGIRNGNARWAEPLVIAALARPEMLLKREAAITLGVVGSSRCIPALVGWLAGHDNDGFRASLLDALRHVAGAGALAVLVDALAGVDDRRQRALLRQAISGLLTMRGAIRLARSALAAHRELIDEAIAGHVKLADGDPSRLAAALHRFKLRSVKVWSRTDVGERLRLEGFSPAAALALLEQRSNIEDANIFAIVRRGFADWLRWLTGDQPPNEATRLAVLELLLEAAAADQRIHVGALIEQIEQSRAPVAARISFELIERVLDSSSPVALRARAITLIRALPPSPEINGLRRYQLLGKLGAVRDRADLDRCLANCRIGPNLASDSQALLTLALAIPAKQADESKRLDGHKVAELERLREQAKAWFRMDERAAERWLSEQLEAQPLELPALATWPWPGYVQEREAFVPQSRADLELLLEVLEGNGPKGRRGRDSRESAAIWILLRPEAQTIANSWARVLAVYLAGEIDLAEKLLARLAATLDEWPTGPWGRTRPLFNALSVQQRRRFLPSWIAAWDRAEPDADALLRALDQELLVPIVRARAERGDYVLLRLLRPSQSLALRELVELVGARAPDEVAHLLAAEQAPTERGTVDLADSIEGKQPDELVALINQRDIDLGLAVRALGRLREFSDAKASEALVSFTRDRRARVRSAAFRQLRGLVSHERRLAAALGMLEIESRRDVIISLLATLAHGHYEPGFTAVLEYLTHRDDKLRDAAEHALLAWGPEVEPLLRRAARKARPDRRRIYEQLLGKLEGDSE